MKLGLLAILPALAVSPLAAQQFEGVIKVHMAGDGNDVLDGVITVKGDRMMITALLPANAGPMAGQEGKIITDPSGTATMLVPMPPGVPMMGNAKGLKMVMRMDDASVEMKEAEDWQLKKGTTSQTVAGLKCDDYTLTAKGEKPVNLCVTKELGRFRFLQAGAGGKVSMPKWVKSLQKDNLYPLKVWSSDNKVAFEVTAIQRKPIPATAFAIPEGYMDASAMMGGMGRRQ